MTSGAFVAVVGPSGAGKDAVIGVARERFSGDDRVVFPRRVITRPAGAGEEHVPASEGEFAAREREGGFALSWHAHGLRYGVPAAVASAVAEGRIAVVNVSRAALAELPDRFARVHVVRVSVPEHVRRERILSRGRENGEAAQARLVRPDPAPGHPVDLDILNTGTLSTAGGRLVALLAGLL